MFKVNSPANRYLFQYKDENGHLEKQQIEIKIDDTDTINDVKEKLIEKLGPLSISKPTSTQDIFLSSNGVIIDAIEKLKSTTESIEFTIAENLDGGRRRRSSTSRRRHGRRSKKRVTRSRKNKRQSRRYAH